MIITYKNHNVKEDNIMVENYTVCHCKKVSYADIANAIDLHKSFDSVLDAFKDVQKVTHCSTG